MSLHSPDSRSQSPRTLRAAAVVMAAAIVCGATGAQDTEPLPDPQVLYRAVRDNLVRAERVTHLYAFKERRTDIHRNPFGRIGTGGTRTREVYPSPNRQLTYRRLVELNGAPVGAEEIEKQDRRYRARVADVRRQLAAEDPDERRRLEADLAKARERRQRRIEDVVDALQFKVERREMYEGVPAVIVSFTPRPGARPDTREGRLARSFAGEVWIHEAAAEVMRVEATSIDNISFGFGIIARVGKGAEATVIRRLVEGDLWMPTQLTLKGRGRAVIFRTLVVDFVVDWFDYRRLAGDSATPFLDSRVQGKSDGGPQ